MQTLVQLTGAPTSLRFRGFQPDSLDFPSAATLRPPMNVEPMCTRREARAMTPLQSEAEWLCTMVLFEEQTAGMCKRDPSAQCQTF